MRALTVGRYQPFHLGHLKALEYVSERAGELIVGVGSSQENHTPENPFTFEERRMMIESSFKPNSGGYTIVPIPDVNDDNRWVKHVVNIIPNFDVVYTNGRLEKKLFMEAGVRVENIPFFDRKKLTATEVRRRIIEDENWEELIPKGTRDVILRVDGVRRIKSYVKA